MILAIGLCAWVILERLALIAADTDLNDIKAVRNDAKNASGVHKNKGMLIGKKCSK